MPLNLGSHERDIVERALNGPTDSKIEANKNPTAAAVTSPDVSFQMVTLR